MNAPEIPPLELPAFDNSFAALPAAFYTRLEPLPLPNPQLVAVSRDVADLLGLPPEFLNSPQFAEIFAGNRRLPGSAPLAAVYSGHQFGVWAGQLGDGRAHLLGGLRNELGHWEIQLKGAGRTPYSRGADGRAVLRSSIREFLCSEAMAGLGVPTTRALSLVSTGESVVRDMFYGGNPVEEPGAIVCRVAPSFLRFGHFELPASRGDEDLLRQLFEFTIARDFPHLAALPPEERLPRCFVDICERTARLMVDWMRFGFVHGVMNTDNMSILGLTIDYGPYGWVDDFNPAWTPNTTDAHGRRYCFARQPEIARWNLERLAEAFAVIAGERDDLAQGLAHYDTVYAREFHNALAAKLGFHKWLRDDAELVEAAFELMQKAEVDMTIFFRKLARVDPDAPQSSVLHEAFYRPELLAEHSSEVNAWLTRWAARVRSGNESREVRIARMNAANPRYVLRNYLAQQAIDRAEQGDPTMIHELLDVLRHPFDEQDEFSAYAGKRPDWARRKPGCSMLSCSS